MKIPKSVRTNLTYNFLKPCLYILSSKIGSAIIIPLVEKLAYFFMVNLGNPITMGPKREREDKFYIAMNVIRSALKAYKSGSPGVRNSIINVFIKGFLGFGSRKIKNEFIKTYKINPPGFLVISPEGKCNLKCKDCYAASLPKGLPSLSADVVEKILKEKYEKWGSWFTVISGGEPFMWKDNETDIIEIAKKYNNQYFLVYTNGTLINEVTSQRLAEVGNITPAISVEGFEEETDKRRGKGTFRKILNAFKNLRDVGVPFGISVTATKENCEKIISDEMIKFYLDEQGASYMWIFQYMPIGRGVDISWQVPPEKRKNMWEKEQHFVRKERRFIADFWNGGTFSSGCIAAGRSGGYLYIDWNGNIYPCVFVPYWVDNINDLYTKGKSLTDALFSNLFSEIRKWQRSYNYMLTPATRGNEIRPCFIRDHYDEARKVLLETKAKPGYRSAEESLKDDNYYNGMIEYDNEVAKLLDPIWNYLYREEN